MPSNFPLLEKLFNMLLSQRVLAFSSGLSLLLAAPVFAGITASAPNGRAVIAKTPTAMTAPVKKTVAKTVVSTTKISINKGSASDLQKVKGIGPTTANLIIKNRPYKSVNDLVTKKILTQKQLQSMQSSLGL